ncbi:MAG: saccharopine dehydrogenase C-terminal domain-containing protein [Candidatus Pacearchaeota archaeon]
MKFEFAVIGATGMQGHIVAKDLLECGRSVLLCGRDKSRVEDLLKKHEKTSFAHVDLRNIDKTAETIKKSGAEVVINCAELDWNLNCLKACIKAKVDSIDLGSEIKMTKKQLEYDSLLKKKDLIHITGCGSIPGICNVMLRHAAEKFDTLESVEAGFAWDSNIKKFVVPFSIKSVIEEIVEPAFLYKNGRLVKRSPLNTICKLYRLGIGHQHCFMIEHAEVYTFYHYFKNKGLKNAIAYGGHPHHSFETIKTLIDLGLGSKEKIKINGCKFRPIDFLTQALKKLKIPKGYTEKENLWVKIWGTKNKKPKFAEMECLVLPLKGWEEAGSNIDTGMPASIIAQMIKDGIIEEKGSFAPEAVVPTKLFFKELRKRKMAVYENKKLIN